MGLETLLSKGSSGAYAGNATVTTTVANGMQIHLKCSARRGEPNVLCFNFDHAPSHLCKRREARARMDDGNFVDTTMYRTYGSVAYCFFCIERAGKQYEVVGKPISARTEVIGEREKTVSL